MTVRDLMTRLSSLPPDATVFTVDPEFGQSNAVVEVTPVTLHEWDPETFDTVKLGVGNIDKCYGENCLACKDQIPTKKGVRLT